MNLDCTPPPRWWPTRWPPWRPAWSPTRRRTPSSAWTASPPSKSAISAPTWVGARLANKHVEINWNFDVGEFLAVYWDRCVNLHIYGLFVVRTNCQDWTEGNLDAVLSFRPLVGSLACYARYTTVECGKYKHHLSTTAVSPIGCWFFYMAAFYLVLLSNPEIVADSQDLFKRAQIFGWPAPVRGPHWTVNMPLSLSHALPARRAM